jgi:hypothetical protein
MLTRRAIAWAVLGMLGLAGIGAPASAADGRATCAKQDEITGVCLVWVEVPVTSRPVSSGTPGQPGTSGSTGQQVSGPRAECFSTALGKTVSCVDGASRWSNDRQCYVSRLEPQPPAGASVWEGRTPDEGAVYVCAGGVGTSGYQFWAATAPAAPAPPPDPQVVARLAIEDMALRAVDIGIVPEDRPDRVGAVGMPVWLWVEDVGPHTWGPITRTASVGGYSVSATAEVDRVEWDMGDGTVVTCYTPGTRWAPSTRTITESPDCGHVYSEQGNPYAVTASTYWQVTWSGIGQSGLIPLTTTASTNVLIGEVQVLIQ